MKVEDLRIGNLVEQGKIIELKIDYTRLSNVICGRTLISFDIDYNKLNPIPLTEKILVDFGFYKEDKKPSEKHSNYYSIYINDYKYSFSFAEFRGDWGFYHSYTDALREEDNNKFDAISFGIKHVHQLQNLHYALTNEELTIKK